MNDRPTDTSALEPVAEPVSPDDFMAPRSIPHYEPGPRTTRPVERNGVLWSVTYHAQHDGLGWLVNRVECRPVEGSQKIFGGGDILHIRVKAGEDFGPMVEVVIDGPTGARRQRIYRSDIVHVETYTPAARPVAKPDAPAS